jgi:hypothetical protein
MTISMCLFVKCSSLSCISISAFAAIPICFCTQHMFLFILSSFSSVAARLQLKLELRAQLVELRRGLGVFGARCEPQLRGLHEHLTGFLQTTADKMAPVLA